MSRTIAEALMAEGKAEGKAEGRLAEAREILIERLEEKFGALPEPILQRIGAETDLVKLKTARRRVIQLSSLDELQL